MTVDSAAARFTKIYDTLREFRLSNMRFDDSDQAYCLVDAMTAEGRSIEDGEEQMKELAAEIVSALAAAPASAAEPVAWRWKHPNEPAWKFNPIHPGWDETSPYVVEQLFTADDPGLWRFWNDKAREQARTIDQMREALFQALGALKALGAENGHAAEEIRKVLGEADHAG